MLLFKLIECIFDFFVFVCDYIFFGYKFGLIIKIVFVIILVYNEFCDLKNLFLCEISV
jgi:hypothetical protein